MECVVYVFMDGSIMGRHESFMVMELLGDSISDVRRRVHRIQIATVAQLGVRDLRTHHNTSIVTLHYHFLAPLSLCACV